MAVLGSVAAVAGCSKDSSEEIIYSGGSGGGLPDSVVPEDLSDLSKANVAYVACPHNCGPSVRCASKVWMVNGRVVRVTSDDTEYDINGNYRDKNAWNDARNLACAKGRSHKYRVYHTGRIKYPMKQTKARGDVTGFVRITWQQAYNEIMRKHRAIFAKYGSAAIQLGTGNGYAGAGASVGGVLTPITSLGGTRESFSDHSFHQYNYGAVMAGVPGSTTNYGSNAIGSQIPAVATGVIKHWVSFGTNSMSTNNTLSYPYLRANQKAKELNPNFKHYVIAPELSDTGVLNATDWVQIRNQTDPALIAAMIYEMIINTFNADGTIKADAWLDVNYIDTMVYGFFDSPEYWVSTSGDTAGQISLTEVAGYRKINAVPSGMSYASWVMGSDDRLTKAMYGAANSNYTSIAYGNMPRAGKCALPIKGTPAHSATASASAYYTKRDYMTPKTPEWAEKICGTPVGTIRELARFFSDDANKPYLTEWTGGLQKSENGVITLFAIQTLFAITKNWGYSHGSIGNMSQSWAASIPALGTPPNVEPLDDIPGLTAISPTSTGSANPTTPKISCKEHFNGLYFAFKDVLDAKGFKGYANPYWDGSSRYLNDDAGAKTQVLYKRSGTSADYVTVNVTDPDGVTRTYNDYAKDANGNAIYVGKRMYIGGAGTQFNQVANTNWAAEIFRLLPLAQDNPDDPETFCMVVTEPYMSPQARFADYVLPLVNPLEAVENTNVGGLTFRRLPVSTPPGEAKDTWDAAFIGWKEQEKLGAFTAARIDGAEDYNKAIPVDAAYKHIGTTNPNYVSRADKYRQIIVDKCNKANSRFAGMTPEQAIAAQIVPKTAQPEPAAPVLTKTTMKLNLEAYLADVTARTTTPFITFKTNAQCTPSVGNSYYPNAMTEFTPETISQYSELFTVTKTARGSIANATHGRMAAFAEYAVTVWEKAYNIHHLWLPFEERGQKNKDYENDPKLLPIPLYYAFEDGFNEMYGVFNPNPDRRNTNGGWLMIGPKPATNDISLIKDKLTLTVGSTHDRYRSHSSQAENPLLRELNHRTKGGGWLSGNDWNEYCVVPETHTVGGKADFNPMLSTAIQKKKMATASWHEFWMNNEDAAQFGIRDGDLIRVSNPVGAIRVIARVTKRIVRGHGQIHQGAWYDPNPADGVDDGACANTLMSNRPSKFDNGNSVHCAYCVVEKETSY